MSEADYQRGLRGGDCWKVKNAQDWEAGRAAYDQEQAERHEALLMQTLTPLQQRDRVATRAKAKVAEQEKVVAELEEKLSGTGNGCLGLFTAFIVCLGFWLFIKGWQDWGGWASLMFLMLLGPGWMMERHDAKKGKLQKALDTAKQKLERLKELATTSDSAHSPS